MQQSGPREMPGYGYQPPFGPYPAGHEGPPGPSMMSMQPPTGLPPMMPGPFGKGHPMMPGQPFGAGHPMMPGQPFGAGHPMFPGQPYGPGKPMMAGKPHSTGKPMLPDYPFPSGKPMAKGDPFGIAEAFPYEPFVTAPEPEEEEEEGPVCGAHARTAGFPEPDAGYAPGPLPVFPGLLAPVPPVPQGARPGQPQGQAPAKNEPPPHPFHPRLIAAARLLEQMYPALQLSMAIVGDLSAGEHREAIEPLQAALTEASYLHHSAMGYIRRFLCGETTPRVTRRLAVAVRKLERRLYGLDRLMESIARELPPAVRHPLAGLANGANAVATLSNQVARAMELTVGAELMTLD